MHRDHIHMHLTLHNLYMHVGQVIVSLCQRPIYEHDYVK